MRIRIADAPAVLELRSRYDNTVHGPEQSIIPLRSAAEARSFLVLHGVRPRAAPSLRHLLVNSTVAPSRLSDDEVLDQIASELAVGALWCMHIKPASASGSGGAGGGGGGAGGGAGGSSPGPARRRAAAAAPALPPPSGFRRAAAAGAPSQEWWNAVNQDAQAATLVSAAQHGTPFCAVCSAAAAAAANTRQARTGETG